MRIIGVRHRVKKTTKNEARPTQVAIRAGDGSAIEYELATETDELDFVRARFPANWRDIQPEEDPAAFTAHHVKWRVAKPEEDLSTVPSLQQRPAGKRWEVATKVPASYDGLRAGDRVAMMLGGSGDRLAFAFSRMGEQVGATVYRIPPFVFKRMRQDRSKNNDHHELADVFGQQPHLFYEVTVREREMILLSELLTQRVDAMKARIGCLQRLQMRTIGAIFLSEPDLYPEGTVEDAFVARKSNDTALLTLIDEEEAAESPLRKAVRRDGMWQDVFEPIEGCGEILAAPLIVAVGDIRRFEVKPDPTEMNRLKQERTRLLIEGQFEANFDRVADRITADTPFFRQIQLVRSWQRANGKEGEATLLDQAVAICQQRRALRLKARRKSEAKLKAALGAHVKYGGQYGDLPRDLQFPRHRTGTTANWNGAARQALFLLADQFNRRPDSVWGRRLLENKRRLQDRHPLVECSACGVSWEACQQQTHKDHTRCYTKGHIHKMAKWRTITQFVVHVHRTLWRLERQKAVANEAAA